MFLNLPKAVMLPLWQGNIEGIKRAIRDDLPYWAGAEVTDSFRYLGYVIGPGRAEKSWEKAGRATLCGSQKLGLR